jgi:hypothetical protein
MRYIASLAANSYKVADSRVMAGLLLRGLAAEDFQRAVSWETAAASTQAKEGLEPSGSFPGNTAISDLGNGKSRALPANSKHVVDNWGSLTEGDRRRIRAIVGGRLA